MKRALLLLVSSLLLLGLDFAAFGALYQALPDTSELLTATKILRTNVKSVQKPILILTKSSQYAPYDKIPKQLKQAVIALEDGKFFEHRGFDFLQIKNAVTDYFFYGKRLRGASTISQQLAKNLYLSSDRSLIRKLEEALITIKLEYHLPKRKILELYFNCIDWGKNVIGVKAAARNYFQKDLSELSLKESAFLAAIIPNPARFGDRWDRSFVRTQMLKALERLYRGGVVSLDNYRTALVEDLNEQAQKLAEQYENDIATEIDELPPEDRELTKEIPMDEQEENWATPSDWEKADWNNADEMNNDEAP